MARIDNGEKVGGRVLNRFQKWADDTGRAYGFIVTPIGNWVTLRRDGREIECYTAAGVLAACDEYGKK